MAGRCVEDRLTTDHKNDNHKIKTTGKTKRELEKRSIIVESNTEQTFQFR